MSLARVTAFALDGVDSRRVWVEADIRIGLPAFTIVGLADKAVREARERVRSAITNSGFEFPQKRITINLAPAYLRKIGPSFDLPLAMSILAASGQVEREQAEDCVFAGELSLSGELRPIRGALAVAQGTRAHGLARIVVPASRACEAALVEGVEVVAADSLVAVADILAGRAEVPPLPAAVGDPDDVAVLEPPDMSDVRGHDALLPAILVAAAGGHNLFLHGPPGTGKTMIARRVPSILPPLARSEAIEVTRIHSIAGMHSGGGLVSARPFRAPHHTISPSGLVGGGVVPLPGEITLAHHGVLFLDELSEFARSALEALRQPLEDGRVAIVRSQRVMLFPTRCMLVAASNPCPCGLGDHRCRCSAADLARHQRRLSGPLLDRIDVTVAVGRPSAAALREQRAPSSASLRERVVEARDRQSRRFAGLGVACNAQMTPRMVRELVGATPSALRLLYELHDRDGLSARGHHRVLRVARTAADLEGSEVVGPEHVTAALRAPHGRRPGPERGVTAGGGRQRSGVAAVGACDACLRRTDLIVAVAGSIDVAWRERQGRTARVLAVPDEDLLALDPRAQPRYAAFNAAFARRRIAAAGLTAVCRCAPGYPERLRDLPDPPAVLHVAGSLGALPQGEAVAIVGSRRATAYGLEVSSALGRALTGAGVPVISGMALGIDSAAHLGSLEAVGAAPVAVLAGGAETAYPARMRHLHARLIEAGAVVSEMPPGFGGHRWCFPARNRIIAALSTLTIVVEAATRSGSLITADLATDLGRTVAAVPGPVTSGTSAGANELLHAGAAVIRDPRDVLDILFGADAPPLPDQRPLPPLEPAQRRVLDRVERGHGTVAELARTMEEAQDASRTLSELELLGLVRREFGGRYVRCL